MSKYRFPDDVLSHRIIQIVLIFELAVLLPVAALAFTPFAQVGLCLALPAGLVFWGAFLWLHSRFQSRPVVGEKNALRRQAAQLRAKIRAEVGRIDAARQTRKQLPQAEHNETSNALRNLQEAYVRNGLAQARIADAQIQGVGPKLKERLALQGIQSAAQVSAPALGSVQGFGQAKVQAMLAWRDAILARLRQTQPAALPAQAADAIRQKYAAQAATNDAAEQQAGERKLALDKQYTAIQPRLKELAAVTFGNFLQQIIASQQVVAGITAAILLTTQICLVTSTAMGMVLVSIPTVTPTSTIDAAATQVALLLAQATQTAQALPSHTLTVTLTETLTLVLPTDTKTLVPTDTKRPTSTLAPSRTKPPTQPPLPSSTRRPANTHPPASGGGCDPSYPTVCIPPPPPDLNCPDIPYKNFTVLPPDPHHFDRDKDGIGCES